MKHLFIFVVSSVLFLSPMAWGKEAEQKNSKLISMPHRMHVLKNGLKVFLVKYPSAKIVAYQLPVRVGSRNEVEKGKTGFAHFFEHLMFRGTKNRTAKEFGELYVRLGCENNAWTWFDMTNYHGVVASMYLGQILEAEADRFQNLHFDEKVLKDEAGAVLGEYHKDVARPEFILEERLLALAFQKHTYAHTTMGYKEDVLNFTERYADVWPFFKRYYRPNNTRIVLVGDISFDREIARIEALFGKWKNPEGLADELEASAVPGLLQEKDQTAEKKELIEIDKSTQTRVAIAYKVPGFKTKNNESAALAILAEALFSATSDFQQTHRFQKKWVDSVNYSPFETIDPGLWTIQLRLSSEGKGHEQELVQAVDEALQSLLKEDQKKLSVMKLEDTKKRFQNSAIVGSFQSPQGLADRIAWYTNFESDFQVLDRHFDQISNVQLQDLKIFVEKYLSKNRRTVLTLKGKSP